MSSSTSFATSSRERVTTRGAVTRAKLVAVAEQLFAERGIDSVSLDEIGKAAGQRNAAACQYHFGDKGGLLQAIIDKHVPPIVARRNELLDQLEQAGHVDLRDVINVLVRPEADKLRDPDGGRCYLRINAQLVAEHTVSKQYHRSSALKLPNLDRFDRVWSKTLVRLELPEAVGKQRTMLAVVLLYHGLADYSRMQETVYRRGQISMDTDLFVSTLEDAIVALLSAPMTNSSAKSGGII